MLNITTDATETMNTKYTCHVNTDIDGVNQICESTDQKNSLQCVNQDLHVAHEYASRTAEFERPEPRSNAVLPINTCQLYFRVVGTKNIHNLIRVDKHSCQVSSMDYEQDTEMKQKKNELYKRFFFKSSLLFN